MIADLLRRLFRRPPPERDAEYGRAVDQLQVDRTREHQRAIRLNRRLYDRLESLRGEAGLYGNGGGD
jgi:hypothetical protein